VENSAIGTWLDGRNSASLELDDLKSRPPRFRDFETVLRRSRHRPKPTRNKALITMVVEAYRFHCYLTSEISGGPLRYAKRRDAPGPSALD